MGAYTFRRDLLIGLIALGNSRGIAIHFSVACGDWISSFALPRMEYSPHR